MRVLLLVLTTVALGCNTGSSPSSSPQGTNSSGQETNSTPQSVNKEFEAGVTTLVDVRRDFVTQILRDGDAAGPPDVPPPGGAFELVDYASAVGKLAAYQTVDPHDGQKHPGVIWITGGDCNSINDVWSTQERNVDLTASAFRNNGVAMMFPSLRGGNTNPGRREGFLGEVDDVLMAFEHFSKLPWVDPERIYLGGHSTGGTLVLLVAAMPNRFRGVISLGPIATPAQYGEDFALYDPKNVKEVMMRSPIVFNHCIKCPTFVFEGANDGNWAAIKDMAKRNRNPNIEFFRVPKKDHFSVVAPVTELIASQIVKGELKITDPMVNSFD